MTDASVRTMSQCYPSCPQYMRSLVKVSVCLVWCSSSHDDDDDDRIV